MTNIVHDQQTHIHDVIHKGIMAYEIDIQHLPCQKIKKNNNKNGWKVRPNGMMCADWMAIIDKWLKSRAAENNDTKGLQLTYNF